MPPASTFKTYEGQSRLLAAVLAAHPELKLNFKAISKHMGSDTTESAAEHRIRPLKKAAQVLRAAVDQGVDCVEISDVCTMSIPEIAKHFGSSTPAGVEFQFRSIKSRAATMREAVKNGDDVNTAMNTLAVSTPPKAKAPKTPASSAKRKASTALPGSTARAKKVKDEFDAILAELDKFDNDPTFTPTKKPRSIRRPSIALPSSPRVTANAGGAIPGLQVQTPGYTDELSPDSDDAQPPAAPVVPASQKVPANFGFMRIGDKKYYSYGDAPDITAVPTALGGPPIPPATPKPTYAVLKKTEEEDDPEANPPPLTIANLIRHDYYEPDQRIIPGWNSAPPALVDQVDFGMPTLDECLDRKMHDGSTCAQSQYDPFAIEEPELEFEDDDNPYAGFV